MPHLDSMRKNAKVRAESLRKLRPTMLYHNKKCAKTVEALGNSKVL